MRCEGRGAGLGVACAGSLGSSVMTHTPPPAGQHDPAGNTQMFRAFVDEAEPAPPAERSGPRWGVILGVAVVAAVLAGVAWLATA